MVTTERRIAWTRLNSGLNNLAVEEYEKREANLFRPGFLEKASKRLESDKTLAKVAVRARIHKGPPCKKSQYDSDATDIRKGASARYGGKKIQLPQPYNSYTTFQSPWYYQRGGWNSKVSSGTSHPNAD